MTQLETRDGELWLVAPWDDPGAGKKAIAGWESMTGWYWFATEVDESQSTPGNTVYFGYVQGSYPEWGYFSQAELESTNLVWKIKPQDLPFAGRRSRHHDQAKKSSKSRYKITPARPGMITGNYDPRYKPQGFNRPTQAARRAGYQRRFNGKYFNRAFPRYSEEPPLRKSQAQELAATYRRFNQNARVVPIKGGYALYVRERGRR